MTDLRRFLAVTAFSVSFSAMMDAEMQGPLRVGAARVDITPPSDPQSPPSGKYAHERLFVRAVVLDNGGTRAALIGADQGGLSDIIWSSASKQIAVELNCPIENILMSATHTHSGWGPGASPFPRRIPATSRTTQLSERTRFRYSVRD